MADFNEAQLALQKEIQERRFYTINKSGETDTYMRALIMLRSAAENGVGLFNRKKLEKEFMEYMEDLNLVGYEERSEEEKAVLVSEWESFANRYIKVCMSDKNYGSYLFGLLRMKEENVVSRMREDFRVTLDVYPCEFGKQELVKPLYEIMIRVLDEREPEILNKQNS